MLHRATRQSFGVALSHVPRRGLASGAPALKMTSDAWQATQLSPAVAFLLHSGHYDPASVKGTGRAGRILKGDVLRAIQQGTIKKGAGKPAGAAAAAASTPASATSSGTSIRRSREHVDVPLTQIRKVIASRLSASKQSIPHAYASVTLNMNAILALRAAWKADGRASIPSVNDLIVRASALALRQVPAVNTIFDARTKEFVPSPTVDISVAVATETGLITPIVKRADAKRLDTISAEVRELASRAKANKLKPDEFQGGSFTISNLGMFGINNFSAIINPPQVCILAVGGSIQRIDEAAVAAQAEKTAAAAAAAKAEEAAAAKTKASTGSSLPFAVSGAFATPASPAAPTAKPVLRLPTSTFMTVTLVSDERAVDGEAAATFLATFKQLMENPHAMQ